MTRLLLITHAATAWNAEGRYQGWSDVPLSDVGRGQVRRLAKALGHRSFDAIIASDLSRAVETAVECGGKFPNLPIGRSRQSASWETCRHVKTDRRLREMNFGDWEGKTASEVEEIFDAWIRGDLDARPPHGESVADVSHRINAFLADLPGGDVAIVGHRGSLRILVCRLLGLPPTSHWSFRLDVASITEFDLSSGRAVLIRLNDTHHLDEREECHG